MKMQIELVINNHNLELIPEKLITEYDLQIGDVVMLERTEEADGQYTFRVLERIRPEGIETDWSLVLSDAAVKEFHLEEGAYALNTSGRLELVDFETFIDAIPRQVFETCEAIGIDIDELIELLRECRLPYENLSDY